MILRLLARISARLAAHRRALQDRLTLLIALAVAGGVAITGLAAYYITVTAVYSQLDRELVEIAQVTSTMLADDLENLGGVDPSALQAANATVQLLRADGYLYAAESSPRLGGVDEQTIAMTGLGWSARTALAPSGVPYRIVAIPLTDNQHHYALILARPLGPSLAILNSLLYSLLFFGAAGVIGAAWIGYVIARSSIEPLNRLGAAVAQITATNRLVPVEVGTEDDEVADLGRAFNKMLRALESSRERQRRLIADAGHELRTPLTSMRTNVELLVADENSGMLPGGARGEILRDVAAQLGEFTTLVGDLVQLSRDDAVQAHPEPIDFREVVESALARVKRRGPGIVWDVSLPAPLYLLGESDALERAVTNLLDNAVKFSPPNGTIHVRLTDDRLRVADEGPGISDEDLPHVFERFFRSDRARTAPGSGLGLSIVKQTIDAHGGWVKADHAAEGGAEFTVRLPGSPVPPEETESE